MIEKAYAKINLALDVKGTRADNYHELEMVMIPINFFDEIIIEKAKQDEFISDKKYIIFNQKNTIVKALKLIREEFKITDHYKIILNKHIPIRAGLGGGSADAAAILRGIKKINNLKADEQNWLSLALKIGADVPFCLMNRPALVTGIGEKLDYFELNCKFYILLVKPRYGVSTKASFELTDKLALEHSDCRLLSKYLNNNEYYKSLPLMKNSLEKPSFIIEPSIAKTKDLLLEYPFDKVLMSGSGSCLFALSKDIYLIRKACFELREKGYFAWITTAI